MIDVHVLISDRTPANYVEQCKSSLLAACAAAADVGLLVVPHFLEAIPGNTGQARWNGYAQGEQRYVSFVDDDDFVDENAFTCMLPALEVDSFAVTTGERRLVAKSITFCPDKRHHLVVIQRDKVPREVADFKYFPDTYLLRRVASVHVPQCVYNWRDRSDSHASKVIRIKENREDVEQERKRLFKLTTLEVPALPAGQDAPTGMRVIYPSISL